MIFSKNKKKNSFRCLLLMASKWDGKKIKLKIKSSSLKIVVPYMCNPSFSGMTVISFNGHLMVVFYFDINKQ